MKLRVLLWGVVLGLTFGLGVSSVEAAKKKTPKPKPKAAARRAPQTYHGYKIAKIYVIRRDIFDTTVPSEDRRVYRLANAIHSSTKEKVIRQQLLFREGDTYDPALARETERALRRVLRLRDVNVTPAPIGKGRVDLVVEAQETWSTEPYFNLSGTGNELKYKAGVRERNLLGYGKDINMYYQREPDRISRAIAYDDPALFGSRYTFSGDYADTEDGSRQAFSIARPFYSSLTRWSVQAGASHIKQDQILYQGGEEVGRLRQDNRTYSFGPALALGRNTRRVRRLGIDYDYRRERLASTQTVVGLINNKEYHAIGPRLQLDRLNFVTLDHIRLYDREEDYNLGPSFMAKLGFANQRWFPESRNATFVTTEYSRGRTPGPGRLSLAKFAVNGRYEDNWQQTRARADLEWYDHFSPRHTFAAHLGWEQILRPGEDQQLLLGGDTGLRGYPLNEFAGNRLFVLNLEDRMFFIEDLAKLMGLGGVVFADAGYAWPRGTSIRPNDLRVTVGAGFRFHLSRASAGHVLRVDVGVPVRRREGDKSWLVTFGTDQVF